jgi:hypothetical protein
MQLALGNLGAIGADKLTTEDCDREGGGEEADAYANRSPRKKPICLLYDAPSFVAGSRMSFWVKP